jgi:hypothetical protein
MLSLWRINSHAIACRAAHLAHRAVRQRPHPGTDRAPHEVRYQEGLEAELSVVAHQQKSSVIGQRLQTVHIWPVHVDEGCEPLLERVNRTAHRLDPRSRIHDFLDLHRCGHDRDSARK